MRRSSSPRLAYLVEAPLRRPALLVVPTVLAALLAIGVAELLPSRYRAQALLRAELAQADEDMLRRRGIDPAERRGQQLQQRITERALVERALRQAQPYGPPPTGEAELARQVERLRADLGVRPVASSSFAIEFVHSDPAMAASVPNVLTELLVDEAAQPGALPAGLTARLEEARRVVQQKTDALAGASTSRGSSGEGESASPGTDRLAERRAVGASLETARARAERLRRLIEATRRAGSPPSSTESELERLRSERAELRRRYTERHPDVQRLTSDIERLESAVPATPDGPTAEEAELRETETEIRELAARLSELETPDSSRSTRQPSPRARTAAGSAWQRAAEELEEARRAYQELLTETQAAEAAARLRSGPVMRFERLREAMVPRAPETPSPVLLGIAGTLVGLLAGLLAAVVAEQRDHSVKGPEDLAEILPVPLLATIPEARAPRNRDG